MPFPTAALSAGNLVKLRGDSSTNPIWYGGQYISLCPNTVKLAAQINGTPIGSAYAQANYDTVSAGSSASCMQDMTVIFSHTNDQRAAYHVGRAWAVPTASILYFNETSAPITDNDYFWVLDDFRIWDKLAREVGGVQYKDYSTSYRAMLPVVRGLQSAYGGWCNSSNVLRLVLDASASYGAQSGTSVTNYSWTVPAGTAYIVGGATSSAITIDIPQSAGDWIHLTITDSGGNVRVFHFFVHPASDTYPPSLGFTGASISGNWDNGWDATIEGFSGLSSVLDNTFCAIWSQEYYNGTEGAIVSTVDFVGRFRQEAIRTATDETYSSVQSVGYQIEGMAAQLSRVEMAKLALRYAASPTVWDQITNLTIWRAIVHILTEHTTFLNVCSLAFDSTDNTFLAQQLAVPGGDSLRAVNDLASAINAAIEFAPQGEARVMRDLRYETTANRNAAVTYINYTTQDYTGDLTLGVDPALTVGKVPASGGYFDSAANIVTPVLALAPGVAQDIGIDEPTLTGQILAAGSSQATAQSELNTRAGHKLEIERGANTLSCGHPDGYHLLIPSRYVWYTWTLAATDNVRGLAYTTATRWLLQSIQIDHDNERGTKQVTATYIQETTGTAGQTITYPALTEIIPALPDIPPFDPYLAFPELPDLFLDTLPDATDIPAELGDATLTVPTDGNAVLVVGGTQAFVTRKFIKGGAGPAWHEITPGLYSGLSGGPWSRTYDFTTSQQGWTIYNPGTPQAVYSAGNGFTDNYIPGANDAITIISPVFSARLVTEMAVNFNISWGGTNPAIRAFDSTVSTVYATSLITGTPPITVFNINQTVTQIAVNADPRLGDYEDFTGFLTGITLSGEGGEPSGSENMVDCAFDPHRSLNSKVGAYLLANDGADSFVYYTPDVYATTPDWTRSATYSGIYTVIRTTSVPGGVFIYSPSNGGSALVRYSSDYGSTFGAAITVGTTPGATGGFDAQGVGGTVSYAAIADQVKKATTLGGAYANVGASVATSTPYLILPWYSWGSDTTKNTGSSPQYLIGLSALVGGGSLYRDDGSGARTDITPDTSGTKALFTSAHFATGWKGKRWAVVGNVAGTPHVYTTSNISASGGGWTDRGAAAGCTFILIPRRRAMPGQYYWNKSGGVVQYTPNGGVTIVSKATPLSTITALDIWS